MIAAFSSASTSAPPSAGFVFSRESPAAKDLPTRVWNGTQGSGVGSGVFHNGNDADHAYMTPQFRPGLQRVHQSFTVFFLCEHSHLQHVFFFHGVFCEVLRVLNERGLKMKSCVLDPPLLASYPSLSSRWITTAHPWMFFL